MPILVIEAVRRYSVLEIVSIDGGGAPFHLLQALLGLTFHGEKPQLRICRHDRDVAVNVLRKEGDVHVAVIV